MRPIRPKMLRFGAHTKRGYEVAWFAEYGVDTCRNRCSRAQPPIREKILVSQLFRGVRPTAPKPRVGCSIHPGGTGSTSAKSAWLSAILGSTAPLRCPIRSHDFVDAPDAGRRGIELYRPISASPSLVYREFMTETDRQRLYREEARLLGEIGAVLARTDLPRVTVRLRRLSLAPPSRPGSAMTKGSPTWSRAKSACSDIAPERSR
jgi:hypothetical protein